MRIAFIILGACLQLASSQENFDGFENTGQHCRGNILRQDSKRSRRMCAAECRNDAECRGFAVNKNEDQAPFSCLQKTSNCDGSYSFSDTWLFYSKTGGGQQTGNSWTSWSQPSWSSWELPQAWSLWEQPQAWTPWEQPQAWTPWEQPQAWTPWEQPQAWTPWEQPQAWTPWEQPQAWTPWEQPQAWTAWEQPQAWSTWSDNNNNWSGQDTWTSWTGSNSFDVNVNSNAWGTLPRPDNIVRRRYRRTFAHCNGNIISGPSNVPKTTCAERCEADQSCAGFSFLLRRYRPYACILRSGCNYAGISMKWNFFEKVDRSTDNNRLNIGYVQSLVSMFDGIKGNERPFVQPGAFERDLEARNDWEKDQADWRESNNNNNNNWDTNWDNNNNNNDNWMNNDNNNNNNNGGSGNFRELQGNCPGNTLVGEQQMGQAECKRACLERADCRGFSFNVNSGNGCIIKGAACSNAGGGGQWHFFVRE